MPLFVWAIQHPGTEDLTEISGILRQLDERGIPVISAWEIRDHDVSVANGLRVGRLQQDAGLLIPINANDILHHFFNGDPNTAHIDDQGKPFFDLSFDPKVSIGCPFAVEHRIPAIRDRVTHFADAYRNAGIRIDLAFADWEIDGPIEWNGAWEASKRCARCRTKIADVDDFESFQASLRTIRSKLQREAYADVLEDRFPDILVGNYAVYPHGGERYWYDYFETFPNVGPYRPDQRARVRPWAHEFDQTGYSIAMSVVYTWYRTFDWYDFEDPDYRWFYNMLQVATNAGRHSGDVPLVSFVHWHTTAPPPDPDPDVQQMSEAAYQELLWHALLRGHDGLFLWCTPLEIAKEIRLLHRVYAESLEFADVLTDGQPLSFDIPETPSPILSAVRDGDRILARCTAFGSDSSTELTLADRTLRVESAQGSHLIDVSTYRMPVE